MAYQTGRLIFCLLINSQSELALWEFFIQIIYYSCLIRRLLDLACRLGAIAIKKNRLGVMTIKKQARSDDFNVKSSSSTHSLLSSTDIHSLQSSSDIYSLQSSSDLFRGSMDTWDKPEYNIKK